MNISSKRAKNVALASLGLSIIFFVCTMLIGIFSGAIAAFALSWQILAGVLIFFVLAVQLHQQSLAEREKLEKGQLERAKDSNTIFQSDANRMAMFESAQKQLAILEKWFIPIFGVVIAAYQIGLGLFLFFSLKSSDTGALFRDLSAPRLHSVFLVIIAFVAFLLSRYMTGMSSERKWKPLRAGGSSFLATAVLAFALAISLAFASFNFSGVLTIVSWAIPIALIVLGGETALNSVMDIYRPRIKGQYGRSAFDSRLLGAISEPGGILHSFASSVDYQFGFKVSQTWFYQLLAKAIIPLVMVGVVVLYLLSCVVVVSPGEEGVIEHLGSFDRIAKPGMTLKLPYPFDKAYIYPTTQIQQVNIGFVEKKDDEEVARDKYGKEILKPMLWGEKHYGEEYPLLVASKGHTGSGRDEDGTVPVSLVVAAIPVKYKINDLRKFMYNHADARGMLEAICNRELTSYASSATIETDEVDSGKESLLGAGRKLAGEILKSRIQKAADSADLGVEIIFLGLQGVHPPSEVAEEYQQVVGAIQQKQALIMDAQAARNKILTALGGSVAQVDVLYSLAEKYQKANESGDAETIKALGEELDKALESSSGKIYRIISEAKAYAFEKVALAEATGKRFAGQVKAYRASPAIYKKILRLKMLKESLSETRKYVIISDDEKKQVFIIDLEETLAPSMYDLDLEELE
ncbi:MAG: protease modulator HflK [Planctomycetes bacterium]|nr:protease modulator HflK [Planctomycetota bacterium]